MRAANEALATKVPRLERELAGSANRLAIAESGLIARAETIDIQRAEMRRLETRLQSAKARREALAKVVSSLRIRSEDDSRAIADFQRQVRARASTIADHENRIAGLSRSLSRVESERNGLAQGSEAMRTRLAKTLTTHTEGNLQ